MNLRLPSLGCLVFFISCTPEDQKVPPEIMSIDSMKVIIWDMTLASEYASYRKELDTTRKPVNTAYFSKSPDSPSQNGRWSLRHRNELWRALLTPRYQAAPCGGKATPS